MSFRKVKISDFCLVTDYVANGSFKSLKNNVEYLYGDGYAILVRLTDFTKNWNNNYRFVSKKSYDFLKHSKLHPGDLIMSNVGEPGRVFLLPDLGKPMTLGPNSILIRPDKTKASPFYMRYYFESQFGQNQILQITSGAAQKKFNKTSFRSLLINLPSLLIQQKIIEKLDRIFVEIDKATVAVKAEINELTFLKQSILKQAFNGELVKLGTLVELLTKGTTPTSIGHKFTDVGINFLKIESIDLNGNFIINKFAKINEACNEALKRSQLKEGDILFSIAGALGRAAIVSKEILPANTNQAIAIIRLKNSNLISKEFLFRVLASESILSQVGNMKAGVAQQNLSLSQLKEFLIPVPPLQIQQRIVEKLNAIFTEIDKVTATVKAKINELASLKQSILKQAFNGELVKAA